MGNVLDNARGPILNTDLIDNSKKITADIFPRRVTVELTNDCNLRCTMCPRVYVNGPKGYISMLLFKKIIDEISTCENIALVPFFRGESLLHPGFIEMMTYAKNKGIKPLQFTTNATLMTEDISNTLIDIELDFISFSVDSIDQGTYNSIRKGADFQDVIKNIEMFCELKKKKGGRKPEIQVSVVKTEEVANKIDEFINYWQDRVDRVRVYEEHSRDGNFGSINKDKNYEILETRFPCMKPFTDIIIYWDGLVALCNHDWNRKEKIGDINKTSIAEIWHNEKYKRTREAHINNGRNLEELCRRCDHWMSYYLEQSQIGELYVGNSKTKAINR